VRIKRYNFVICGVDQRVFIKILVKTRDLLHISGIIYGCPMGKTREICVNSLITGEKNP